MSYNIQRKQLPTILSASYATTASYALNASGGSAFPYTGSAIISGSLVVTGSIRSTAGITGSLQGTASWSDSSSQAITASYISTLRATGSNTQIQYNKNGILAGTSSFAFDDAVGSLSLIGINGNILINAQYPGTDGIYLAAGIGGTNEIGLYNGGGGDEKIAVYEGTSGIYSYSNGNYWFDGGIGDHSFNGSVIVTGSFTTVNNVDRLFHVDSVTQQVEIGSDNTNSNLLIDFPTATTNFRNTYYIFKDVNENQIAKFSGDPGSFQSKIELGDLDGVGGNTKVVIDDNAGIIALSGSVMVNGTDINSLLKLTAAHPLPSGQPAGTFAVSSSNPPKPYFYDGVVWNPLY